jgi:hypothetical protein
MERGVDARLVAAAGARAGRGAEVLDCLEFFGLHGG